MKVLSLYVERDTFIHKLEPVTKLLYALVSIVITFLFPSITVGAVFVVISLFLAISAKVFKRMILLLNVVLIILLSIVIIQGLFYSKNATPVFKLWGLTFYKEGLLYSLLLIVRVVDMIISFGVLILTTRPSDLVDDLVQKGLSPRFGYVLASVLQIIPQMLSTTSTITDAQRSRGLETEGNLLQRFSAFFALLGPLVLNSLVEARERAMAIEIRGFGVEGKRTFVREIPETKADRWIKVALYVVFTVAVVWRIVLWIM
ncbi:MAG TPA: energy-coupling factor transporter transmembrane protein EcfT [Fervidobacterium sp.]|nr:energy-coupling factor transporter transmembrane protein EcfT [Fervidobacterium sp.]HPT54643.1 energy-coupling factor transporter transmembrane protein EcfT [Fervidobacterium sp.]HPZ17862.1 energy-coupling factor transporter transmembrane protein EcfT [Fervidobacterium sp.]HQE48939.1 energy-coupling factor transporter transmembrane protein EcfT [Fervidobacterium sp.]HUM42755.1 energy-coupling factor transporter transmembrane protein EcfT [Fervidobacterium sp.]